MIIEQTMPALSPTMTEGTIIAWKIKQGDKIKPGQVIAEIQTDKAVGEWEAADAGTVAAILIQAGTVAKVNMVAAIITTKDGEDAKEAVAKAKKKNEAFGAEAVPMAAAASASAHAAPAPAPAARPISSSPPPAAPAPIKSSNRSLRVSPVASRIAAQNRVDISQIKGTGPDGRIIKRDIERALTEGAPKISGASAKPAKPRINPFRADAPNATVPMTQMRSAIGKRLLQSKTSTPHWYVTERVDCENLVALREQLNAIEGVKISFNDLVVRAAALALRMHPKINSTFDGTNIKQWDSADISIAVAIPDGLITPILFKAHALNVRQISDAVRELAKKATSGTLKPAEFEGGTFTISNLGMYGIEQFDAIINPPQTSILAVGGIKDEPVVKDGAVVPGKTMRLTLSSDHRVIDGATGAEFMSTLRQLLETPAALLL